MMRWGCAVCAGALLVSSLQGRGHLSHHAVDGHASGNACLGLEPASVSRCLWPANVGGTCCHATLHLHVGKEGARSIPGVLASNFLNFAYLEI